jgi:hypothetical protein
MQAQCDPPGTEMSATHWAWPPAHGADGHVDGLHSQSQVPATKVQSSPGLQPPAQSAGMQLPPVEVLTAVLTLDEATTLELVPPEQLQMPSAVSSLQLPAMPCPAQYASQVGLSQRNWQMPMSQPSKTWPIAGGTPHTCWLQIGLQTHTSSTLQDPPSPMPAEVQSAAQVVGSHRQTQPPASHCPC